MYQTETDGGNWTWRKIQSSLSLGVVVYDLWNMVLDEGGLSIDSDWPWPRNSAVVVDTTVTPGRAYFTPMFYAMGPFSRSTTRTCPRSDVSASEAKGTRWNSHPTPSAPC